MKLWNSLVFTDCNYTHVIGSYCNTCVTGRVGYICVTELVQCNYIKKVCCTTQGDNKYLNMLLKCEKSLHGHFVPSKIVYQDCT